MGLKRIKADVPDAPKEKDEIPVVDVEGTIIRDYNKADSDVKKAEAQLKELKPDILEQGIDEIFAKSCANPTKPVLTVKLRDTTGETLRVQFTAKYGVAVGDQVEAVFKSITRSDSAINAHVEETVQGKFNCAVFNNAKGAFDEKKYNKYMEAISAVSRELGDACPLETFRVVKPKETFHLNRWTAFPKVEQQKQLSQVLPNVTSVVPIRVVERVVDEVLEFNGKKK